MTPHEVGEEKLERLFVVFSQYGTLNSEYDPDFSDTGLVAHYFGRERGDATSWFYARETIYQFPKEWEVVDTSPDHKEHIKIKLRFPKSIWYHGSKEVENTLRQKFEIK